MSDVREMLRQRAQNPNATKSTETGNYVNPGAVYLFEVSAVKVFAGYKSKLQGVIEFKVIEAQRTEAEEFYAKRNKYPNQPGSTCSITMDLLDDYKMSLFTGALAKIVDEPIEELLRPVEEGKPELVYETLCQMDKSAQPSVCVGLLVKAEAFERPNQKGTSVVTKMKWTSQPKPAGHPLAAA